MLFSSVSSRTVEDGSPVSQGPFFKGSSALAISQGLVSPRNRDFGMCLERTKLILSPTELEMWRVTLKDLLWKHKKCKSNLLKLIALKNWVAGFQWDVMTWSASESNPCFCWKGRTPWLVSRNTLKFFLEKSASILHCLYFSVNNFSQINSLFNSSSTYSFQQLLMCLSVIRLLIGTESSRRHANDSGITSFRC